MKSQIQAWPTPDVFERAKVTPPPPNGLLNGLAAYWKLDEASGTRADATGNGNDLTDVNSNITSAPGKIGNAAKATDGLAGFLSATVVTVSDAGDCSLAFWIKLTGATAQSFPRIFFIADSTVSEDIFLGYVVSPTSIHLGSDGAEVVIFTLPNVWLHIVLVRDFAGAGLTSVYANGAFVGSVTASISQDFGPFDLFAGVNLCCGSLMDESGWWNRILTAADVTALYNGGAGLPYTSFTN